MIKNRKGTLPILLDLHYKYSINAFEEFYGDSVSYTEIEQVSYIDFKDMVFEKINKKIKFRKFGREGRVLTIKMNILPKEYELFLSIFKGNEVDHEATKKHKKTKYVTFNFLHDFEISNIRDLTREEKIRFKKPVSPIESEDEQGELHESDTEENINDN